VRSRNKINRFTEAVGG